MSSHWYTPPEGPTPVEDSEQSSRVATLLDQTLEELQRAPDLDSVIASTKAWSRTTWFTMDGDKFYLCNHKTDTPYLNLPPSSRNEVVMLAQNEYRRMYRYMRLYDRFLKPKIQQIMDSDLMKAQKVDRVYWLRLRFPAYVACRVPVVFEWEIDRFCWGWDYYKHQEGYEPSKSQQRSNRMIDSLFADASILWS